MFSLFINDKLHAHYRTFNALWDALEALQLTDKETFEITFDPTSKS